MKIWIYTITHNNERWIPFFLKYYEGLAEKIVVFDNESTDNTPAILKAHPKVELRSFSTNETFDEETLIHCRNNAWKESKADWVFVLDSDELVWHPNLKDELEKKLALGYSIIVPQGHEMISDFFPEDINIPITEQIKTALVNDWYSKPVIFSPKKLTEINYYYGCHTATPQGEVLIDGRIGLGGMELISYPGYPNVPKMLFTKAINPQWSNIKLLHYRMLGYEAIINRWVENRSRLSNGNLQKELAIHYLIDPEDVLGYIDDLKSNIVNIWD